VATIHRLDNSETYNTVHSYTTVTTILVDWVGNLCSLLYRWFDLEDLAEVLEQLRLQLPAAAAVAAGVSTHVHDQALRIRGQPAQTRAS
jgi:hypothetical protein